MKFTWQSVEGLAYNLARQCDTPVGKVLVKQTRPGSRKFVVRIGHEVVSRFERNMETAMAVAEETVLARLQTAGQNQKQSSSA
jgi:hypothetical protein